MTTTVESPTTTRDERLDLASQIADLQDAGADRSAVKPLAKQLFHEMRKVCQSYWPHREDDSSPIETMCQSGYAGSIWEPKACLNCEVFNNDFHPAANKDMRTVFSNQVASLIQIGKLQPEAITELASENCIDITQVVGLIVRSSKSAAK